MIIYDQEKIDNLAEKIIASTSITVASVAEPADSAQKTRINNNFQSLASYEDSDLYYVQSILVTSSWNKNDDIFTKEEVWAAKNTPEDKPTNLEHNEGLIIGHIIANWPISDDGVKISEDTPIDDLPEKFHIVTGSVIYRAYTTPELKERTAKLIAEIENGTKYVSMECMFKGFDYGLIDQNNNFKVLSRGNETAFLTKHLRAYGGSGKYEDYKLGRVLRNITFSGKGYVDRPANPDSIIFTNENFSKSSTIKNTKKIVSGVSEQRTNTMENINMNSETQVADQETVASDCAAANEELSTRVAALETELANTKSALDEALNTAEAAKKMTEEEMSKKEEMMKKTKADLDAALEAVAAYKNKEAEMMKKEKNMKRMASLVEKGIDQNVAQSAVEQFDSLEDAAFEAMVDLVASAAKKAPMPEKKKMMASEEANVEEALDSVEPNNEIDLSAGSDTSEGVETTRAALVDFVYARLGKKLNKGE